MPDIAPVTESAVVPEPFLAAWRSFLGAHAALLERIEAALAAESLPPLSWYDVLWALYSAPDHRRRMGELSAEMVTIGRTGLSRLVDRIEAEGLLRRETAAEDRRGSYAVVTPEGVELLRRMWPVYGRVIRSDFAERLTEEEARVLGSALGRLSAARSS